MKKISIVVPIFNEVELIDSFIEKVKNLGINHEIIFSCDPSNDGSEKKLEDVITSNICPNLDENDIIIFPAYLKHMVKKCRDSITISGNINII